MVLSVKCPSSGKGTEPPQRGGWGGLSPRAILLTRYRNFCPVYGTKPYRAPLEAE